MCSKLTAGQSAGIGFGLDAFGALAGYSQQKKDVARQNDAIARQNQLAINSYNTKNRNAKLAWENDKLDGDIAVDNKWKETKDAVAEAQLQARESAGKSAIAQQQILTKMINAGSGREQAGRRSGGRAEYLAQAQQWAAQGAQAAFSRDSSILFQDKAGRNMAAFAQGKYVEYITGRPSPEAPPILEEYRKGPSFLNTALQIAGAGLNRYNEYKGNTNKPGWNNVLTPPAQNQDQGTGLQNMPWTPSPDSPSISGQLTTMEVPTYSSPNIFGQGGQIQAEMDDYFDTKSTTNWENSLGINQQDTFGIGG